MSLTAQQIVSLATQVAQQPNYGQQAGQLLNSILGDLCQTYDFDLAKRTFNFTLTPASAQIGNLNAQLASGPFALPLDYLRTKINDVLYFPSGLANFPLRLTPIDLGEFDGLVQQSGFQNFPVFWVTDMSQLSIAQVLTGVSNTASQLAITNANTLLSAGMSVAGPFVQPGTLILSTSAGGGGQVNLTLPMTAQVANGIFSFGTPPIAYVWPPASGSYPAMVRYYSQMPDIYQPSTSTVVPWFPNQEYLRRRLAADLMEISIDPRMTAFDAAAREILRNYLEMKDDTSNRSKRVELDGRRFGRQWSTLPKSKIFGY